jgi:hypothetical protein
MTAAQHAQYVRDESGESLLCVEDKDDRMIGAGNRAK